MRKFIFTLLLAVVGGTGAVIMASERWCMPSYQTETEPSIVVSGVLADDAFPCEPEEECPACLTIVLQADEGLTYYLTAGSTQVDEQLDTAHLYANVTIEGVPFTRGSYNYIKVSNIDYILPVTQATKWYGVLYEAYPYWPGFTEPRLSDSDYSLQGDTVISGKSYSKLCAGNGNYVGAIRYSASGRQAYYVPIYNEDYLYPIEELGIEKDAEYLLYDLNVQVGDTVRAFSSTINLSCERESLDKWVVLDVQTIDGRIHAHVKAMFFGTEVEWIEGIGTPYIVWSGERDCQPTDGSIVRPYTLCAADNAGNILYSYNLEHIGVINECPNWSRITPDNPPRLPSLCDTWNVMVVDNVTCGGCEEYHTYRHYLTTDTIIRERHYRKLLVEGEYEGALREGDNKNIYCVPAGTTHEYLLYDFNAKVGDKLENVWLGGSPVDSPDGYVLTVDSVSETTPRIYSLHAEIKFGDEETHTWSFRWVEGVGLSDGPVGAKRCLGCADSRGYAVLCAYKDGKQVYASDLSEEFGCYYDNTIDDTPLRLPSLCDEWNILREWFPDGLMRYDTHTERLTTDTIIGGHRYVKLEGREYRGALREGKNANIYIIPPHSTHEYLLYAFHVQVGDVLDNVWFGGSPSDFPEGCKTTITAIEEVNGYKEFKLDVEYKLPSMEEYIHYSGYSWIDGVGLHAGASGSDCPLECAGDFGTSVLCAYKNGEQVYTSPIAEMNGCEMYMKPYFPEGMRWTYLAYPMNMDTVFYNEIRVQGKITYDDIVYQNIGGYPVRAIGKQIVARIDEVGEIPLYDFGLNVGESIVTFVPYNNGYYTTVSHKVTAVDSVMLLNGTQARRQIYDDGMIDIEYIGASTGDFFRRMQLFMPFVEGSYRYLCCSVGDELLYEFSPKGCSYDPYSTERADTVPLYVKDGPGSSTVDPVDPNEIVATLNGDELIIREYIGAEISFKLSKVSASNQAPARRQAMQSDSFRESVTITLTESGTYELELTNPEWNYSIVGTFVYTPTGVEETPVTAVPAQKVLMNGRLLIKYGDKVYTLTGMQVE